MVAKWSSIVRLTGPSGLAFVLFGSLLLLHLIQVHNNGQALGAEVAAPDAGAQASVSHAATADQQDESYQRVYEAFSKLVQNVSNNSLGNARRLVSRLNQLVGGTSSSNNQPASVANVESVQRQQQQQSTTSKMSGDQSADEKTEQLLTRLDQVNPNTDQNTLRQLNEDVNRLVGTLSESYLRNIRRLIERVNRVVGTTSGSPNSQQLHQIGDQSINGGANSSQPPGFPGWDELIVAVDRVQKSLANFVRSSTKLITSGR